MEMGKHVNTPRQLLAYHDRLLFMLAYPANNKQYEFASAEIRRLNELIQKKLLQSNHRFQNVFSGSGVPSSLITGSFSFAITKWLVQTFPDDAEIDSSHADEETVQLFLREILPRTEYESIFAGHAGLLNSIKRLKGKTGGSALSWLIHHIDAARLPDRDKESIFHNLRLYIRWNIRHPLYNRTMLRSISTRIFYHKNLMRRANTKSTASKKLPTPKKLYTKERAHLINTARSVLTFLYRETEPFTYADTNELTYFELERGLSIALFGMTPERRLSIESYIGYLVFKNNLPVAYGGGWLFGQRCQFGINILPPFRGGESALVFAQLLRVYKQYYGAERFVVKPYQFGKNNTEALQSGAFWFYFKAGFRPEDDTLKKLAATEWRMKQNNKLYRTPVKTLKMLTGANMILEFSKNSIPQYDASVISRNITTFINSQFNGKRDIAIQACTNKTKKQLNLTSFAGWNSYEQKAFCEWSLLVQATVNISYWKKKEKKQLISLIKTKGSTAERTFIQLLQRHRQFWKYLSEKIQNNASPETLFTLSNKKVENTT